MKSRKGFTIFELTVVIVIIIIILLFAIPKVNYIVEEYNKDAFKNDVKTITEIAKLYYKTEFINSSNDKGRVFEYGIDKNKNGYQINSNEVGLLKLSCDYPTGGTVTITKDGKIIIDNLMDKKRKWCANKSEIQNYAIIEKCGK